MSDGKQEKNKSYDRSKVFPDAMAVFQHRYDHIEDVADEALFVLDTNTLLFPYSLGSHSIEDIQKCMKKLVSEKKLFIPTQVAREFASNRPGKLTDLHKSLNDLKSRLTPIGSMPACLEAIEEFRPFSQLQKDINEKMSEIKVVLGNTTEIIRRWNWDDPVSKIYRDIITEDVLRESSKSTSELETEFKERCEQKIPPGYKDTNKDDEGIGDYIIWKTILEIGNEHKEPLVFVSGEEKADWMHRSEKHGLFPRYELIDEYRRASNGKGFHLISFPRFLEIAGAKNETVQEATDTFESIEYNSKAFLQNIYLQAPLWFKAWEECSTKGDVVAGDYTILMIMDTILPMPEQVAESKTGVILDRYAKELMATREFRYSNPSLFWSEGRYIMLMFRKFLDNIHIEP